MLSRLQSPPSLTTVSTAPARATPSLAQPRQGRDSDKEGGFAQMLRSQAAAADRGDTGAAPADGAAPKPGRKAAPTAGSAKSARTAQPAERDSQHAAQPDTSTLQAMALKTESARQALSASPSQRAAQEAIAEATGVADTDARVGADLPTDDAAAGRERRVEDEASLPGGNAVAGVLDRNQALPALPAVAALPSGAQAAGWRDSESGGSHAGGASSPTGGDLTDGLNDGLNDGRPGGLPGSPDASRPGSADPGQARFGLAAPGQRESGTSPLRFALSASADAARAGPATHADSARGKAVALEAAQLNSPTSNSEAAFERFNDGLGETLPGLVAVPAAPLQAAAATPAWAAVGASPSSQAQVLASPGTPAFAAETSAQISFFARQGVEHARLHLNPADMGPVTVQIQLDGLAATVNLTAENAQTRAALESALPQLAGSLREAGLTLSGGGVFDRSPGQSTPSNGSDPDQGRNGSDRGGSALGDRESGSAQHAALVPTAPRRRGVVDLIA